jgi:hypothetical protein
MRRSLALVALAAGCSGPSKPPAPVDPTPDGPTWICYAVTEADGGTGGSCFETNADCEALRADSLNISPSDEHGPCEPHDTAQCFTADILDDAGAVEVPQHSYCFVDAAECEEFRQIALADKNSAQVAAACALR